MWLLKWFKMLSAVAFGASLVMTKADLILLLLQRRFSMAKTVCPQKPRAWVSVGNNNLSRYLDLALENHPGIGGHDRRFPQNMRKDILK